jgi:HAD superfamily hydrolase (TIGR01509 family)
MNLHGLVVDYGGVLTDVGDQPDIAEPPLCTVLRVLRKAGIWTALLSNADAGARQPEWEELCDAVVLSGEVGVAKPDPRIYRLAVDRLGLDPEHCVFVDDLPGNVVGAVNTGMVGVHHRTVRSTVEELEVLFDLPLLHQGA